MIQIMFVCHGNICRSPMAQFVFQDMVNKRNLTDKFHITSSATSTEELGNPVHPGTRSILHEHHISAEGKYAVQLRKEDYEHCDYLIAMDQRNIRNMYRLLGTGNSPKVFRLLDITSQPRDIADPWYTGDFERTYQDIEEGCTALLKFLEKEGRL